MAAPAPSPIDIQHHLYGSFLEGRTADVALRVVGSWNAVYHLHRVVLIQAGFFKSLFEDGFAESAPRLDSHGRGPTELDIYFDDPNITRAAFEVCISRLYGGGPPLYIPSTLKPTTSEPLTPCFPHSPYTTPLEVPAGHHLATPRFLLSLLATSVYLSIPFIASQALSTVLHTIGPYTALQYLDFARGKPLGAPDSVFLCEPEAAVGLEHVAKLLSDDDAVSISASSCRSHLSTRPESPGDIIKEDPTPEDEGDGEEDSYSVLSVHKRDTRGPTIHYGSISDKIGEASASWLARWGVDIFRHETGAVSASSVPLRRRAATIAGQHPREDLRSKVNGDAPVQLPPIWRSSGLPADWVKAIISSDFFFAKGERERYNFAKSVVELRRQHGIVEAEEREWEELFDRGIYYANMNLNDVIKISQDISPTTHRPYVKISTLQAAQWNHSLLRHHITYRSSTQTSASGAPASPPPIDKELGLARYSGDLRAHLTSVKVNDASFAEQEREKLYYRVASDSALRIGENNNATAEPSTISMDDLFSPSQSPSSPGGSKDANLKGPRMSTSVENYFGLYPHDCKASACMSQDSGDKTQWSPYPPFRFGVEFWDLDALKEKQKLHSQTIWYAGSLFSIYVQAVRKKSQLQLGVYLHRQSAIDIPPMSVPNPAMVLGDGERAASRAPVLGHQHSVSTSASRASTPRSTTPVSSAPSTGSRPQTSSSLPSSSSFPSASSPLSSHGHAFSAYTLPSTVPGISPEQPYRDSRREVTAYFTISCASPTGNAQTRFSSAPDVFKVSQSWGWRSGSLVDAGGDVPQGNADVRSTKEVSLRATVVLGLV